MKISQQLRVRLEDMGIKLLSDPMRTRFSWSQLESFAYSWTALVDPAGTVASCETMTECVKAFALRRHGEYGDIVITSVDKVAKAEEAVGGFEE